MRMRIAALAALVLLAACSDPKQAELPADIGKWDSLKPSLQKLSQEDRDLFSKYAVRRAMKDAPLFGAMAGSTEARTVGDAIQNQREFMATAAKREGEEKALKAKLQADRDAALKLLREAVTVALISKAVETRGQYVPRRLVTISVGYKNNTEKDVAGVKGRLRVTDLFGDELTEFGISNDDTIKAGGSTVWKGERSMEMTFDKLAKFAELAEDKYKVEWLPEMIVFVDGSKLQAPK